MAYSVAFRAHLRAGGAAIPILKVVFPDQTREYSSAPAGVVATEDRVLQAGWGGIRRAVSELSPHLAELETTVQLSNTDRALEQILEGQYVCRGSVATIYLAAPGLDSAEWPTIFTGILVSWEYQPGAVRLILRSDSRALDGFVPKLSISKAHFQLRNFSVASEGVWAPLIFGNHDSSGLTGKGFVPLVPVDWVDTTEAIYCVCLGTAKSVPAVYKNGTATAIGFSVVNERHGGASWTLVDFASSFPLDSDVLTADVEGYDADGTGSGALVTNPVNQLWLFLDQFVWSDQRTWDTSTWGFNKGNAPIDIASWEAMATKFSLYNIRGARYLGGQAERPRAVDVVNEWLTSFPFVRMYWNASGQLALTDILPEHPGYGVAGDRILMAAEEEVSGVAGLRYDDTSLARRVTTKCLYSSATGTYVGSVDAQDLGVPEDVTDEIACIWYEGSGP